jgi:hypothetical protein
MSTKSEKEATTIQTLNVSGVHGSHNVGAVRHADDVLLAELGYKSEFKREFSVSRLFSFSTS